MISATLLALAIEAATCSNCPSPDALVIGHRGSGASTTDNPVAENTLPSISNAFEEGADMVEIDVHLSRDGEVVLIHDFSLDKTTSLKGCVADYDYATLATADATVGSGATKVVGLPLLSEALDVVKTHDKKLNIELKVQEGEGGACGLTDISALINAVVDEVEAAGLESSVILSSFSFDILKEAKTLNASIPVALLTAEGGSILQDQAAGAKAATFEAINPLYVAVTTDAEGLEALKETGLQINPWTVNDAKAMEQLYTSGVHGVITDDVPAAVAARAAALKACPCPVDSAVATADNNAGGCRSSATGTGFGWLVPFWILAALALRKVTRKA